MKRPTAVFARTAVTISKQILLEATWFPMKSMDSQREPKACDAILQAVGERSQLILDCKCLEEKNLCRVCQATRMFVLSKTKQTGIRADVQGVPISWKCRTGKVHCRTGCCQNYSQNIGHAIEIVKVC